MSKPWEETWELHGSMIVRDDPSNRHGGMAVVLDDPDAAPESLALAAAAPALVRALLVVEQDGCMFTCHRPVSGGPWVHVPGCAIHEALSMVGLDTHEKCDAARKGTEVGR